MTTVNYEELRRLASKDDDALIGMAPCVIDGAPSLAWAQIRVFGKDGGIITPALFLNTDDPASLAAFASIRACVCARDHATKNGADLP